MILGSSEGHMDIERTMQVIVDQQAQFSNDIARINSVLLETARSQAESQNKSEHTMLELEETMLDVANAQGRTNETLATVAERQNKSEHTMLELEVTILDIANTQER